MSSHAARKGSGASAGDLTAGSRRSQQQQQPRSRRGSNASTTSSTADEDDAAEQLANLDIAAGGEGAPRKKNNNKKKRRASNASASSIDEDAAQAEGVASSSSSSRVAAAGPVDPDLVMQTLGGKPILMHREPWGRWSMTDYAAIKVRSLNYLTDGVKIPPPCPPAMEIAHLEIYQCDEQIFHVCQYKDNWLRKHLAAKGKAAPSKGKKAPAAASSSSAPDLSSGEGLRPFDDDFWFVVNFHVQNEPTFHLTMYFQRRDVARAAAAAAGQSSGSKDEEYHEPRAAAAAKVAFDTLFERFVSGSTEYRNSRLKLIPFVVDGGNWLSNKALTATVGNRPVIIGTKMDTTYYCDPALNYMEIDIDVSGSRVGSGIFRIVRGYASVLTLDLTLLIEGQEDDELPEVILGGCRLRQLDLNMPEMRQKPRQ